MSLPLNVNGTVYNYPETDDVDWGPDATDWAAAVTTGMLQKSGGLFQLLAEVDFGTSFGIKALYYKSRTTNPASAGQIRLARADVINWRNQANNADLSLGVSSSDVLQFNGADIQGAISVSDTTTIHLDLTSNVLTAAVITGSLVNADINAAAAIAYSKLALTGSIVNADINAAAAIAYSKLALTNSIVNADISSSAAIDYSKLSLTGSILNADISASAAIAFSKLAALTSAHILVGNVSNVATSVAVSGDVTITNAGVTAIGANKVINSMLAQMAQSTFKGRAAGAGTGDPVDLSATQATAVLNNFVGDSGSGGTKGLVLAPAAGDAAAGKFLKADGTWTAPTGSGDVVGPASATNNGFVKFDGTTGKLIKDSAATIANADVASNAAIAFSKLAALSSANIIVGSGTSVPTAVAVTGDISLSNTGVTAYTGTVPLNKGGTGQTTKAAAFNALSPMTAEGDLIFGGAAAAGTALAIGTVGQVLTVDGTGSFPVWQILPAPYSYVSQATTLNPAVIGSYYVLSGASFTVTLPTAASIAGRTVVFQHGGTTLSQVYTFNTTSSQTIGGIASGSYKLSTTGETLTLVSDGSNWQIQDHYSNTAWASYTPTFGAGFGTTSGATAKWRRSGNELIVHGSVTSGTTAGSTFSISLPSGITIDTAGLSITANALGTAGNNVGELGGNSHSNYIATAPGTSTSLIYVCDNYNTTNAIVPQSASTVLGSGTIYSFKFTIPVSTWQP